MKTTSNNNNNLSTSLLGGSIPRYLKTAGTCTAALAIAGILWLGATLPALAEDTLTFKSLANSGTVQVRFPTAVNRFSSSAANKTTGNRYAETAVRNSSNVVIGRFIPSRRSAGNTTE